MSWRVGWGAAARGVLAALALALVLSPLAALVAQAAAAVLGGAGGWASLAVPTGRRATLLAQSASLALAVALAGMALGVLAGVALWRLPPRQRALARWAVWVAAFVPPYVHALAWSAAADRLQRSLVSIGFPRLPMRGWGLAWWVQVMALAPLAVGLALAGLQSLDRDAIDAARPLRPDTAVLLRVALPMAAPLVAAGGALLFLLTLTDYAVPSLFQVGVYAMELLTEFSAHHEPARALLLALPLALLAALVVAVGQRMLPLLPQRPGAAGEAWGLPPRWPPWLVGLQTAAGALMMAQLAVPLVALVALAIAEPALADTLRSAGGEIAYSLGVAAAAALVALPVALALGPMLARGMAGRGGGWLWLLAAFPVAVPAPLVGVGLIALWNRPGLEALYDSSAMPVLAAVARFAPLAVAVVAAQWRRVDPAFLDVARVLQARPWQAGLQVTLPLLAPGCLAGMGIVFVLSLGELGATLLVAPPGRSTLTLRIYNYLHYGASGDVAGLCLVVLALALLVGAGTMAVLAAWGRLLPDNSRVLPDGSRVLPDNSRVLPDGSRVLPDGSRVLPDGSHVSPDRGGGTP